MIMQPYISLCNDQKSVLEDWLCKPHHLLSASDEAAITEESMLALIQQVNEGRWTHIIAWPETIIQHTVWKYLNRNNEQIKKFLSMWISDEAHNFSFNSTEGYHRRAYKIISKFVVLTTIIIVRNRCYPLKF